MRKKYPVNRNAFLNEDDLSYYLLGAYMSDGNVFDKPRDRKFSLGSRDIDWVESIRDVISPTRPITKRGELVVYDVELVNWLIAKGCVPNKSLTLRVPSIPKNHLADFVRGYFDGDGSVSLCQYKKRKGDKEYTYPKFACYICSGSEGFIVALKEQLDDNGFNPCFTRQIKSGLKINNKTIKRSAVWYLSFADQSAIKFTDWTHYKGHRLSMARKLNKIKKARVIFSDRPGTKWDKKT